MRFTKLVVAPIPHTYEQDYIILKIQGSQGFAKGSRNPKFSLFIRVRIGLAEITHIFNFYFKLSFNDFSVFSEVGKVMRFTKLVTAPAAHTYEQDYIILKIQGSQGFAKGSQNPEFSLSIRISLSLSLPLFLSLSLSPSSNFILY